MSKKVQITRKALANLYNWTDPDTGIEIKNVSISDEGENWFITADILRGDTRIGDFSFQISTESAYEPGVVIFDRVMMDSDAGEGVMTRFLEATSKGYKKMGITSVRMGVISEGSKAFAKKNKFKKFDENYWELKIK